MTTKKQKLTPSQDALERACGMFLVEYYHGIGKKTTPLEQYEKLKKVQKDGNGYDDACEYAGVCDALENLTVDEVISQVESLSNSFLSFLQKHSKA